MMRRPITTKLLLACISLVLLAAAAPAGADEECFEQCTQARRICHRAAAAARSVCSQDCREAVAHAIRRTQQICEERGLTAAECAPLLRETVAAVHTVCRRECRQAHRRARRICAQQVRMCHAACTDRVDPDCVLGCREQLDVCSDDLGACKDGCIADRRQAIDACLNGAASVSDPEGLRACISDAWLQFRACAHACHDELPCGADAFQCVRGCASPPDPAGP